MEFKKGMKVRHVSNPRNMAVVDLLPGNPHYSPLMMDRYDNHGEPTMHVSNHVYGGQYVLQSNYVEVTPAENMRDLYYELLEGPNET